MTTPGGGGPVASAFVDITARADEAQIAAEAGKAARTAATTFVDAQGRLRTSSGTFAKAVTSQIEEAATATKALAKEAAAANVQNDHVISGLGRLGSGGAGAAREVAREVRGISSAGDEAGLALGKMQIALSAFRPGSMRALTGEIREVALAAGEAGAAGGGIIAAFGAIKSLALPLLAGIVAFRVLQPLLKKAEEGLNAISDAGEKFFFGGQLRIEASQKAVEAFSKSLKLDLSQSVKSLEQLDPTIGRLNAAFVTLGNVNLSKLTAQATALNFAPLVGVIGGEGRALLDVLAQSGGKATEQIKELQNVLKQKAGLVGLSDVEQQVLNLAGASSKAREEIDKFKSNAELLASVLGTSTDKAIAAAAAGGLDLATSSDAATAAFGALKGQAALVAVAVAEAAKRMKEFKDTASAAFTLDPITKAQGLADAVHGLAQSFRDSGAGTLDFKEKLTGVLGQALQQAIDAATRAGGSQRVFAASLESSKTQIIALGASLHVPTAAITNLIDDVSRIPPEVQRAIAPLGGVFSEAGRNAIIAMVSQLQAGIPAIEAQIARIVALSAIGLQATQLRNPDLLGKGGASAGDLKKQLDDTKNQIKDLNKLIKDSASLSGGTPGAFKTAKESAVQKANLKDLGLTLMKDFRDGILKGLPALDTAIQSAKDSIARLKGTDSEALIAPLTSFINSHIQKIRTLELAYDHVTDKVKKTHDAIKSLGDQQTSFSDSVTKTLTGSASISSFLTELNNSIKATVAAIKSLPAIPTLTRPSLAAQEVPLPTAGALQDFLNRQLTQLSTFSSGLAALTAQGLSKSLLAQLAQGGVSGLPVIQALLAAQPGQLAGINAAQNQIDLLARQTGQAAAFTQFNTQLTDANITLKQQLAEQKKATKALEDQVAKLIKALEAIIGTQTEVLARAKATKSIAASKQ